MRKFLVLMVLAFAATSCIPTSRLSYLQESKDNPSDSLMTIQRVQSPYRLQVADILSININAPFDDQGVVSDLSSSGGAGGGNAPQAQQALQGGLYFSGYSVSARGTIRIPQLGEVLVIGKTIEEVRILIEDLLFKTEFKKTADLFVDVKLEGLRYTMVGEVSKPGLYVILRDQVSIVEAVAQGGGIPITGNLSAVKIIRQYDDGIRTHVLNLNSIDVIKSPYYYLRPNDMIVFDPLPQKSIGIGTNGLQTFTTALSVFATLVTTYLLIDNLTN